MNLSSIIILVFVLVLLALALRTYFSKGHCAGSGGCGGANCSACKGCGARDICRKAPGVKK